MENKWLITRICGRRQRLLLVLISILALSILWPSTSTGQEPTVSTPLINLSVNDSAEPGEVTVVLQIFLLMTVLSLAPAILIMLTSFTRIVIVLSVLRQAMGTHSMPPNQIILGLALMLTFFIMNPVWQKVNQEALQPYLDKKITRQQALETALKPIRAFMVKQTREKDLALLVKIAKMERPKNINDVPTSVLPQTVGHTWVQYPREQRCLDEYVRFLPTQHSLQNSVLGRSILHEHFSLMLLGDGLDRLAIPLHT